MAVFVPKAYFETLDGSATLTFKDPVGHEVQTPPCLVQNEQVQARAGISDGSGSHLSTNEMLPQWHLPLMSMVGFSGISDPKLYGSRRITCLGLTVWQESRSQFVARLFAPLR